MIDEIICLITNISVIFNYLANFVSLFLKPEYLTLLISTIAIVTSVYISYRDRRYMLAKEEYFKYQQIAEKIIAKLLLLENKKVQYIIWAECSCKVDTEERTKFIEVNDTFNKESFDKNCDEIAALITIYFPELGEARDDCLIYMSRIYSQTIILREKRKGQEKIDREEELNNLYGVIDELGERPKEISNSIKEYLKRIKKNNLR